MKAKDGPLFKALQRVYRLFWLGLDFNLAYRPAVGVKDCVIKTPGIAIVSRQEQRWPREGREGRGRAIFVAETSENAFATVATSQNDDPAMDAFAGRRLETVQGEFITAAALSLKVQALWTIVNEGGSALKDVPLAVKNVLLSEAWREREWGGRIIKQAADGLSTRWKNLSKTTVRH
jgi:hypothetical protein